MKMKKMTKVQVPMSLELKTKIEEKAEEYGFSSTQELIRFVLTQVKNGSLKLTALNTIPEIEISEEKEKSSMCLISLVLYPPLCY